MSNNRLTPESSEVLKFSEPDSRRFAYRIFRGATASPDPHRLLREIVAQQVDIAIVRSPVGHASAMQPLAALGLSPIHADTLVYYRAAVSDHRARTARNHDLTISEATGVDLEGLQQVAALAFAGYISHYSANPLLDAAKSSAGYIEWASGYLTHPEPGKITWVARRGQQVVGFVCCMVDRDAGSCEIVLNAVHPDHAGGGVYTDLVRHAMTQCSNSGIKKIEISTQIWNHAVQKVWAREGFALHRAYDTYHINALLHAGETLVEREFVLTRGNNAGEVVAISDAMQAFGEPLASATGLSVTVLSPLQGGAPYLARVRLLTDATDMPMLVATMHDAAGDLKLLCYANTTSQESV
ncbi:GNAT family N-acetyltransferase [Lysobacter sp. Root690]|uniref:GNAT family N-acetyltransferase n=1 Tax=Lysobacter sp. Root690 TaxID=1736588 RepID=UPI0006FCC1B1|nr:GNAT family N-acetyltransferase [Lysobacter sp. Root690]KRB11056.1 hypothetical protein ASD86_00990 [Lysobacter sp. Root690]